MAFRPVGIPAVLLGAAALAACGGDSRPTVPPPAPPPAAAAPAPPAPSPVGPRGPAGEVPPSSRRPHDPGDPEPRFGFGYAAPGLPGSGSHYHVLVPDAGDPVAALAGGTTPRPVAWLLLRTRDATAAARTVAAALEAAGRRPVALGPEAAGGCGGEGGHVPPGAGLRAPPQVRIVRVDVERAARARVEADLAGLPGLRRLHGGVLGGVDGGADVLDVHLVEE